MPAGWVIEASNWPQLPRIWLSLRGSPVFVSGSIGFLAALQVKGRAVELAAILEQARELIEGLLAMAGPATIGDRLVDLDGVELVRQRESLDAGRQPGDGLVVLQGVEGKDAWGPRAFLAGLRLESVLRDRLGSELIEHEIGKRQTGLVEKVWIHIGRLGKRETPALAVVPGLIKTWRHTVVDRRAVGFHGRSGILAAPAVGCVFVVVGQGVQGRQALQPP